MMEKFVVLATSRCSEVTAASSTPKTSAARAPVDVFSRSEGREQALLARDMGEDAELDLRVVGGHEAPARLRDEGRADAAAELRAMGMF